MGISQRDVQAIILNFDTLQFFLVNENNWN